MYQFMIIGFIYLWLSMCVGFLAGRYGRWDLSYAMLSIVFTPVLVWLLVLSIGKRVK